MGKFLPFHKGHEALIAFAARSCDHLTVVVCSSDKESISGTERKRWITDSFPDGTNLEVVVLDYLESELANTSLPSMEVSRKWGAVLQKILPGVTVVVTSEPYGELLADSMNIAHVPFDISRTRYPVSASRICAEPIQNWSHLPLAVQQAFSRKVVILGTESTGKTMLSEQLAAHYDGTTVHEAGRDLIPSSLRVTLHDLHSVAIEHARRIDTAARAPSPLIIIDTDVHTTMSYSRFLLGEELKVPEQILRSNAADLYLYLGSQVPFVQDGTRLDLADRNRLDISHRTVLREHGILFHEIEDVEWNLRFLKAKQLIDAMLRQAYRTRSD